MGEAKAHGDLGNVYFVQGQHDRARDSLELSNAIFRELGNKSALGSGLGNLGNLLRARGENSRAIEVYSQAIELLHEVGDQRARGTYMGNLGNVYVSTGESERAFECYTKAIEINRTVGDKRSEWIFTGNLAEVLFALQRLDEATAAFREAIDQCNDTIPVAAGAFRGSFALLLAQQEQLEEDVKLEDVVVRSEVQRPSGRAESELHSDVTTSS